MKNPDSDIEVTCVGDESVKTIHHLVREVDLFSNWVAAKHPRSGGPLTTMERGAVLAYLRYKIEEKG
tara:strand:+ start:3127 stop:3327 length:201 start_codon:yes stop_codon:yes gene_type:complete